MIDLTEPMVVSINPTYYCNLRCSFCYLTPEQLSDRNKLDLSVLKEKLDHITHYRDIATVDLYGGEIQLLPDDYMQALLSLVRAYKPTEINITTNLTVVKPYLYDDDIHLYVSYDSKAREQWERVLYNAQQLTKPFNIILLTSPDVIALPVEAIIDECNSMPCLKNIEIKPYSPNQANDFGTSDYDHECFVWRFIENRHRLKANLSNVGLIKESLNHKTNAFTQKHLYITPKGEFGVLEFDENDREYFSTFDTYDEYVTWIFEEFSRVTSNPVCSGCIYFGRCLSEHLRHYHREENSCSGHRNLLTWFDVKYGKEDNLPPWKAYMLTYNATHQHHDDAVDVLETQGFTFVLSDNDIIDDALEYVIESPKEMRYPAKSYVCGLVYALTIADVYRQDYRDVLSDPDLFLGDDAYFVPYTQDPETYDRLLMRLNALGEWMDYPWPSRTRQYCLNECLEPEKGTYGTS